MRAKWRKQNWNKRTFETEYTGLVIVNVIPKDLPTHISKGTGFLCIRILKDLSEKYWTSQSF